MNIMYFSNYAMSMLYAEMSRGIIDNNFLDVDNFVYFVPVDLYDSEILARSPKGKTKIVNINKDFDLNNIKKYDYKDQRRLEKKYGIPNLWIYTISDRKFGYETPEKRFNILCWYLEHFENLYKKNKIDVIVTTIEGGFVGIPLMKVAESLNIPILFINLSRFPDRLDFSRGITMIPINFIETYDKVTRDGLSDKELIKAKEIVSNFRDVKPKATGFDKLTGIPKFAGIKKTFIKIKNMGQLRKEWNYKTFFTMSSFARNYRHNFLKLTNSKLFHDPVENEKFFYFPLQYQPEISTELMAPYYVNQKIIIDFISKSLPVGYYLYVKEHPASLGTRGAKFYKDVAKFPRIKIIKTEVKSMDLTENSAGVITINSTAGFEAYVLKKPIIVFSDIFYSLAKKNVYPVKDIYKLPYIMKEIVENQNSLSEEDILNFCYSYYSCSFPGRILPPPDVEPNVLDKDNIDEIAKAMGVTIKSIGLGN